MKTALAISLALLVSVPVAAVYAPPSHVPPKEIGSRTVVLDFTVDGNAKPVAIDLVSSEAVGLNFWAKAMIKVGHIKTDSPGVAKIGEGKFRATIGFSVADDGAPPPPNITLPKARLQPGPIYPFGLARADIPGGVLLKLTIDEKARISKVELIRSSHREFGTAAIEALKKWRFSEPAKKDGIPITITLFQLITFEIDGKPPAVWEWQMCPEPALPEYLVSGSYVPIGY